MGQFATNDPLGSFSLVPTPFKSVTQGSYLNFADGSGNDFAQQYLPEIYEAEVERYGNRTISGFLRMVGAEMPMTSDQVVWSEQNRLHLSFESGMGGGGATTASAITILAGGTLVSDVAGEDSAGASIQPIIRAGSTVVIYNTVSLASVKCFVDTEPGVGAVNNWDFNAYPYDAANLNAVSTNTGPGAGGSIKIFIYGSEFAKGTDSMAGSITPSFTQYNNSPVIIKDQYEVSGSDAAQIGWVEVTDEAGLSGYLWYLKAEGETRLRFQDYLEMVSIEGELAAAGSAAIGRSAGGLTPGAAAPNVKGTEGLFAAIEARGNVYNNFSAATGLTDFDKILANLDKQGAIEENMLFLNRNTSLDMDDMLAAQNSYGAGGTSYGVFENSSEMALNLGFSGFRRGSYDFYKTDWKYLNDASTRGLTEDIDGVLVPAGTTTVYDQMLGTNIRRPFLHVRYRASEADDRRMKSWITGSVGGAATSGEDVMKVHFLSERCLVTQAANNFVLFKSV
jgi:hypothetical protein